MKQYILLAKNADGKSAYIDDVPNGKKCGCFCLECGGELVAKNKGKIKVHHFAHASGNDSIHCSQTALHRMAKEIIAEEKMVPIPKNGKIEFRKAEKIELEKSLGDIKPDVLAVCENRSFMVEILVMHAVDDEKQNKIEEHKISCVEIDLSNQSFESKEDVKLALKNLSNMKIIYDDDFRIVQERKDVLLKYGLRLKIERGGIVGCPALKNYVLRDYCAGCVFCCKENNDFMRCGFILPFLLKPELRTTNILANEGKVMFYDEAENYNKSHFGWKASEAVLHAQMSRMFATRRRF